MRETQKIALLEGLKQQGLNRTLLALAQNLVENRQTMGPSRYQINTSTLLEKTELYNPEFTNALKKILQ